MHNADAPQHMEWFPLPREIIVIIHVVLYDCFCGVLCFSVGPLGTFTGSSHSVVICEALLHSYLAQW